MGLVLKIAIASAALAAAFVYGSEHGTTGARPVSVRTTIGTSEPAVTGAAGRGVRVISLAAREPA